MHSQFCQGKDIAIYNALVRKFDLKKQFHNKIPFLVKDGWHYQMAFNPPSPPIFGKSFFFYFHAQKALFIGPKSAT